MSNWGAAANPSPIISATALNLDSLYSILPSDSSAGLPADNKTSLRPLSCIFFLIRLGLINCKLMIARFVFLTDVKSLALEMALLAEKLRHSLPVWSRNRFFILLMLVTGKLLHSLFGELLLLIITIFFNCFVYCLGGSIRQANEILIYLLFFCSIVNECGASIYSVTKDSETEFPGLDPNLRSAG